MMVLLFSFNTIFYFVVAPVVVFVVVIVVVVFVVMFEIQFYIVDFIVVISTVQVANAISYSIVFDPQVC